MFFKGVLTTEGLAKSLLPEVDPLKAAQPYVERLIKERWTPQKWGDVGLQNMEAFASIIKRLPISLAQLLDDFDHQRLYLKVEHIERKQDQDHAMRRQGILVLSIVSIGWMALGISGLFLKDFYAYGLPVLSILSILVALGMQFIVIMRVWIK